MKSCENTNIFTFPFITPVFSQKILMFIFETLFQTNFEADHVRSIVRDSIKTVVGNAPYTDTKITFWTNAIIEACLVALTKLQKPFKYIGKITF